MGYNKARKTYYLKKPEGNTQSLYKALLSARIRQHQMQNSMNQLFAAVKNIYEDYPDESEAAKLVSRIVDTELGYAKMAREIFEAVPDPYVNLPFRSNKMPENLQEASSFFHGQEALNIFLTTKQNTQLGDSLPFLHPKKDYSAEAWPNAFWGTTNSTLYSTKLTFAYFALADKSIADIALSSPIHHVTPFTNCFYPIPEEAKLFYDNGINSGYGEIHSSFVLGGARLKGNMYLKRKKWGPHDCSSYVQEACGLLDYPEYQNISHLTLDMYQTYLSHLSANIGDCGLARAYDIVKPWQVKAGDVLLIRRNCHKTPYGDSGHTGIITEVNGSDLVFLGVDRYAQGQEGIGFETWHRSKFIEGTNVCFLRSIYDQPLHESFSVATTIQNADDYMAANQQEYVSLLGG